MEQPSILIVEDDPALTEALSDTLSLAGYGVVAVADGVAALEALASRPFGLVISDVQMPRMDGHELLRRLRTGHPDLPVLLMTAFGSIPRAVEAMQDGACDYLAKPFEAQVLLDTVDRHVLRREADDGNMVAEDPRSRELADLARRVAMSDATVLVTGESGTGKEVLARFIHRNSARSQGPFVAINCAAIPDNMLEATLFGYEKGAFTGAYKASPGKFEQAQNGTLLLDEISEMPLALQAKLLRVLQEREVERLGAQKTIPLDVRVVATSNRNMPTEVAAGSFREDLYYRLNVFPLHMPSLRERPADIVPLAHFLAARQVRDSGRPVPRFDATAQQALLAHPWPGNVRELDNLVQRALILQPGQTIGLADLRFERQVAAVAPAAVAPVAVPAVAPPAEVPAAAVEEGGLMDDVKSHEWRLILEALQATRGSRKETAERLGLSPRTLRYKLARMREAGIELPGDNGR